MFHNLAVLCGSALKRCCAYLDVAAGTNFAAQDAAIEARGTVLMRCLLSHAVAEAADKVRQHVWGCRSNDLLPRLQCVAWWAEMQMVQVRVSPADRAAGGGGGEGSSSRNTAGILARCPAVAMTRDVSALACARPGCMALPGPQAPLRRCKACSTRYCRCVGAE